jgi:hypothetical protein
MEYLLLLCMAVSSYVRKGVSAAAAVRLILYFDWEDRPSLAFYGNFPKASWLQINPSNTR